MSAQATSVQTMRSEIAWTKHVASIELRKFFSYRADFWFTFTGSVFIELAVAYFLWKSIFEFQHAQSIGGYGFRSLMLYYLLVPLVSRITIATGTVDRGFVSQEIYEGSLSRYLVYPVPFFLYKLVGFLAQGLIGALQLLVALAVFVVFLGLPEHVAIGSGQVFQGLAALFLGAVLYFSLVVNVEMVAFWAESVWSLLYMLRMVVMTLGGSLIPVSFFPEKIRVVLPWLPFEYLFSFPVRCFMGQLVPGEWPRALGIMAAWAAISSLGAAWIWKRGLRHYSGVGI